MLTHASLCVTSQVEAAETETAERLTTFALVTITLTDINDNAPYFDQTMYNASVQETATANTPVTTVTVEMGLQI